ncbi:class I SAM-dependent methyltransferase [Achromobacter aloeverae]|uniref:S-adenosyl-L-methionine-dependent methyltransferase n=1 Tax=Achromobacter aloeverae TaxID=1750518 RepID=A0A4Q1HG40_9BURK|nr:class I SAM-dependent methyltransferase [Achromobacter aloeverae]RXN85988.1 SAM-dependent methyltransferase [Achromobacter aloeverae]
MTKMPAPEPESSAARVALWRALHLEVDAPPPILEDRIGLELLAPDPNWRERGDMHPGFTRPFRASIVARARYIEDLVAERAALGVDQYVILGAGLDSYAQRRPQADDHVRRVTVYEIDRPGPQAWKRRRLTELDYGPSSQPRFVPVDFEAGDDWRDKLAQAGFDMGRPAVVVSTGVSMYLSKEANLATLRQVAAFAPGSTFAMTFLLPLHMADPAVRPGLELAEQGARASGTPFISFFLPEEIQALARDAGFAAVRHVTAAELGRRYFSGRSDGLRPPENAEELLIATT